MAKLGGILLMLAFCTRLSAARREPLPPMALENCPDGCKCTDFCELDDGEPYCTELEVICDNADVRPRLNSVPVNTTRLYITGEDFGHTTLDIFARFINLNKLSLPNNTIRSLKLSKAIGLIDYLNLNDNKLCFLPRKKLTLLTSLQNLKLSGNNLTFIHETQFPTTLTNLDLSHNRIESPRKRSFRGLRYLEVLRLQNNSITKIVPRAFAQLTSLETLYLDKNQIVQLPQNAFRGLPSISYLGLTHNLIERINPTAFRMIGARWHGQHQIRLEYNQLRILQEKSFEILYPRRRYYKIYLEGNPLFCDCVLTLIRDKFGKMFRDFDVTECSAPIDTRGIQIADFHIRGCDEYDYDDEYDDDDYYYDERKK